jgi:F0F1-type ATP synthase membrane subunit b/b'
MESGGDSQSSGTSRLASEAREEAAGLRQGAAQAVAGARDSAKHMASELGQQAKQQAQTAAESVRQGSRRAAQRVREQGSALFSSQKERAAAEMSHFSSAIRCAADELRTGEDHRVAELAELAADQVDDVVDYVKQRDPAAMLHDVERVARRRPEIVFGAMFLAGLGISRFLKASARRRMPSSGPAYVPSSGPAYTPSSSPAYSSPAYVPSSNSEYEGF